MGEEAEAVDCINCDYGSNAAWKRLSWVLAIWVSCSTALLGPNVGWAQETDSTGTWYPEILRRGETAEACCTRQAHAEYPPYLPDFSYAGYRWGEQALPDPSGEVLDVRDFGAVPDDSQDDTGAIRQAIRTASEIDGDVIVRFPPGRFIVREILFIERSHFVLQGSGSGEEGTELYVPRPLKDMQVPSGYEEPLDNGFSQFSWRGGVIWTRYPDAPEARALTRLTAGRRGHHTIKTVTPVGLQPGDVVQIRWYNREGRDSSLLYHIYCSTNLRFGKNLYEDPDRPIVTQEVTVERVNGRIVTIKEPLLHDLREDWTPTLYTAHFLEEVGIEGLRIAFPDDVEYAGHHSEEGYNGIHLNRLLHSWVRDVALENVDSGILSDNSKNLTLERIEVSGRRGHYSIHLGSVYGGLAKDFQINSHPLHNPSFNTRSRNNVYTNGFVSVPQLDQHTGLNHQNLFDNLSVRYFSPVDRLFQHGGGSAWGPTAGAFNTFWNIRVNIRNAPEGGAPVEVGQIENAPHARLVGLRGNVPIDFAYGPEPHIEGVNQPDLAIPSLYEYQLEKRLTEQVTPSLALYNPLDGYRFEEGETVLLEAEIRGAFEAAEVRFLADGEEIGTDTDGTDGWSVQWEDPSRGFHTLSAIGIDEEGNRLAARPLSCTGQHISIWVGGDEGILKGNYPNPFRERTRITYTLPQMQRVRLEIYDVLGRKVRTLLNEVQRAGEKEVEFDARGLASGLYFYRLDAKSFQKTGKATLVR